MEQNPAHTRVNKGVDLTYGNQGLAGIQSWYDERKAVLLKFTEYFKQQPYLKTFLSLLSAETAESGKLDFPFEIDMFTMITFDPALAHFMLHSPNQMSMYAMEGIMRVQIEYKEQFEEKGIAAEEFRHLNPPKTWTIKGGLQFLNMMGHGKVEEKKIVEFDVDVCAPKTTVQIRFINIPPTLCREKESLSNINADDIDRLIMLTGVVTRVHSVMMIEHTRYLRCSKKGCDNYTSLSPNWQSEHREIDVSNLVCDKPNKDGKPCRSSKFDKVKSDHCDYQEIKITDVMTSSGASSQSLILALSHDMCNR